MKIITEKAYAKLNLCLAVGDKAENGYHYVESVMQSVSLYDTVTVEKADSITLVCDKAFLPTDEKNLAYKAAKMFFENSTISGGAHIKLEKSIPVCAGMGGGSADAAAVLRALNVLYGAPINSEGLLTLAAGIGADVPFCVNGGTAFAYGFGEKLAPLPHIKLYYVLLTDETPLSTPEMYKALDLGLASPASAMPCKAAVEQGNAEKAASTVCNSFLLLAADKCPKVSTNIKLLKNHGAVSACITGKGPTVFGVYTSKAEAEKVCAQISGAIFCESV